MVAGKKTVFRQTKLRGLGTADQKGIVLVETESAAKVRPGRYPKRNFHLIRTSVLPQQNTTFEMLLSDRLAENPTGHPRETRAMGKAISNYSYYTGCRPRLNMKTG